MAGVYIYTLWPTNLLVRDIIHEWTGPLCGFKIFLVSTNKHFTQGSVHSWITSHIKRFLGDYIRHICSAIIKEGIVLIFNKKCLAMTTNIINAQIVKILYFQITRVLQDLTPEIMPPVSGGKKPLDAGAKFDGAQPLLIYSLHSPVSPCTIVQYTVCPDMMMLQLQVHWFSVYRKLHKSLSYWDYT